MTVRQIIGALATLGIIVVGIFLLSVLGLLLPILLLLGLALFLLIVAAIAVFIILSIILVPYYFFTKRPKVEPGSYRLEEIEEK